MGGEMCLKVAAFKTVSVSVWCNKIRVVCVCALKAEKHWRLWVVIKCKGGESIKEKCSETGYKGLTVFCLAMW